MELTEPPSWQLLLRYSTFCIHAVVRGGDGGEQFADEHDLVAVILFLILAQIYNYTGTAPGLARYTDVAPVQDQPVMGVFFKFIRHEL